MAVSLDLINWARKIHRHPRTLLELFDDAGAFPYGEGYLLVKVDGFAASRALYPWCSMSDLGFRAVSAAVSDVIAKGCRPLIYAISIGVTQVHFIEDLVRGVEDAVKEYGGYIENFDTNFGKDTWIDVFIIAECRTRPIPRNVEPGAVLVLANHIGLPAIAYLEHYVYNTKPSDIEVIEHVCRPRVHTAIIDVIEKHRIAFVGSVDVSDTLAETLHDLVTIHGYGAYLDFDPSSIANPKLLSYTRKRGLDVLTGIFMTHEEYVPIFVVREPFVETILEELRKRGLDPAPVGHIVYTPKRITWRGIEVPKFVWHYAEGRVAVSEL